MIGWTGGADTFVRFARFQMDFLVQCRLFNDV